MAVTLGTTNSTPCRILAELTQDGNAGTTLTVSNAALIAATTTQPAFSPIRKLISAAVANQAAARTMALLCTPAGGNQGGVARVQPRGVASAWAVDANAAANVLTFAIVAPAAADVAILEVLAPNSPAR